MPYYDFLWTDDIAQHIGEHAISQDDFEYVVCNPTASGASRSSILPAVWGYTPDDRYIMAIFELLDPITILPVTA